MSLVPTREEVPQFAKYGGISGQSPAAVSRSGGGGFSAKDLLRMLRRRKWLIIITFVLFVGASVTATFLWLRFRPIYSAFALLDVKPPQNTVLGGRNQFLPGEMMTRYMTSIAQASAHEAVLRDAIGKIRNTEWFVKANQEEDDVITALLEDVSIQPLPNTTFIQVSMSGTNPQDITRIVNAVAEAAVTETSEQGATDRQAEINQLQQEKNELLKISNDNLEIIKELQRRGIGGEAVESQRTLEYRQLNLERLASEHREAYVQAATGLKNLQGLTQEELAELPEIQAYVQADPILQALENQIVNLKIELERAAGISGPEHRSIQSLQKRLEAVEKTLQQERAEKIQETVEQMVQLRQSQFQAAEAQYQETERRLQDNDEKLKALEVQITTLGQARETRTQAEEQIVALDRRLMELRLLMRGEQQVTLRRVAQLPTSPSQPKFIIMIPLGGFLGLAFGVGLALLLEFMDTSVRSPSDVKQKIELPLLGTIPHLDDIEEEIDDLRVLRPDRVDTLIDEAFRQVRTNLVFSGSQRPHRTLMITSPMPEDGRTTVTLNLAQAMVSAGQRVLVVDANFRQPMIRRLYPDCPEGGLSVLLNQNEPWQNHVHDILPGLSVLPAGPIPPNPTELFGSPKMRSCLQEFTEEYDRVLFDSAPCLVVSDALILSTIVDGTVLVVRAGENSYGIVQRSRDTLLRLGTHIFGVVLNGVKVTAGGYLRKNYETFYEYRETPQLPAQSVAE